MGIIIVRRIFAPLASGDNLWDIFTFSVVCSYRRNQIWKFGTVYQSLLRPNLLCKGGFGRGLEENSHLFEGTISDEA